MADSDAYNFEELIRRVQQTLKDDGVEMSLLECCDFTKRALSAWGALDVDEIANFIYEHE